MSNRTTEHDAPKRRGPRSSRKLPPPPGSGRKSPIDPLAQAVGKELRAARQAAGFAINEVAAITGWSRQTINTYENGHAVPPINKLVQLADLYKVSLDRLARGYEVRTAEAGIALLDEDLRAATLALYHHPVLRDAVRAARDLSGEQAEILAGVIEGAAHLEKEDLELLQALVRRMARK